MRQNPPHHNHRADLGARPTNRGGARSARETTTSAGSMACCGCPCWYCVQRCFPVPIEPESEPKDPTSGISLDALPSFEYEPRTPEHGGREHFEEECSICLATLRPGDVVRRLPCKHCFHQPCIDRWLTQKARCPLCNGNPIPSPLPLAVPQPQTMLRVDAPADAPPS